MGFTEFKNKLMEMKDKAVDGATQKIAETSLVLDTQKKVNDFISKTIIKNISLDNGEVLSFSKKVIVIVIDFKTDLYKDFILNTAVDLTKGFAQNTPARLVDKNNGNISYTNLSEDEIFMLIFEDNKQISKITGEKQIKRILKELYKKEEDLSNKDEEKKVNNTDNEDNKDNENVDNKENN